jgi:hypothetical protein
MSNFDLPVRIAPAAHDVHPEKPRVERHRSLKIGDRQHGVMDAE